MCKPKYCYKNNNFQIYSYFQLLSPFTCSLRTGSLLATCSLGTGSPLTTCSLGTGSLLVTCSFGTGSLLTTCSFKNRSLMVKLSDDQLRIYISVLIANFKMQVWACRISCCTNFGYFLSLFY